MSTEFTSQYDPKATEPVVYKKWLDAKAFHAVPGGREGGEKRFSCVIPPPNVTGALHLGHAINGTIQDILIRYHRMLGDNTLWMPGIDHAGIATQAVVEKTIFEKEKKSRHDLGREELVRRIWEWKEQFGTRILSQMQSIGSSCDWDRTRFTLDDICARAVREAFFKMFNDGLIFRGKRLVNWDTHLQTAVADDEIYHETVRGQMTSIRYPVADSPGEFLIVATTRPETMLGDTAVAVHPDDPRYRHLIGREVIVPLVGRRIPVIADGQLVDPKFGTGVVKVTPAHDPNDYATGQRHNLGQINLLTPDGKVNEHGAGEFQGKPYSYTGLKFATAARKQVLADLETLGLIAEAKPHEHEVGHSDRSKTPIEPYLSDQWFVRMGDIGRQAEPESKTTSETRPSGSVPPPPHSNAAAYFITFHTYATWLHGEEKGSVDPENNTPGSPFIPPDSTMLERDRSKLAQVPLELSVAQRKSVLQTLREVVEFRGWTLHAANVRSTHVHAVVSGNHAPERVMNDFKSYATRRMNEAGLLDADMKPWSRHGSTRYLWKSKDIAAATKYTLLGQGENAPGTFFDRSEETLPDGRVSERDGTSETRPSGSVGAMSTAGITLANGARVSGLAQAAMDAVTSGRVKITPERYAKGYLDWLGQKRDWCISRQLWWGHRIPVWNMTLNYANSWSSGDTQTVQEAREPFFNKIENELSRYFEALDLKDEISWIRDELVVGLRICPRTTESEHALMKLDALAEASRLQPPNPDGSFKVMEVPTFPNAESKNAAYEIVGRYLAPMRQDPDVLDTWFSSALWPLSTMGWPSAGTSDKPEDQLLPYFYPTSVLSTARDILTLWVARMVMFGLYCKGDVPFRDVLIHPVIQDGEGKIMSKSKGNGVDPLDIVTMYGADAMRFTLASMATETQDIRMPVVKDPKTGVNTSPKFDLGRNFANKIWNASRFILGNIDEAKAAQVQADGTAHFTDLADRWILSRLNETVREAHEAINAFRFADLANSLYGFFWTDLCDWYLEISKARIKAGDAVVQSVLLQCLTTALKLLHPVMPFITEAIWEKLPSPPGGKQMLIVSAFPVYDGSRTDAAAEGRIALVQEITRKIRDVKNQYNVPPSKVVDVTVRPKDAAIAALIEATRNVVEPLSSARLVAVDVNAAKPENAAAAVLAEAQIYIAGLVDKDAEAKKLAKRRDELAKFIAGNKAKLGNEAFVGKAPASVVQGLRDQLGKQESELAAVEKNLAELGA